MRETASAAEPVRVIMDDELERWIEIRDRPGRLRPTDEDVVLDLQPLIDQCHERGRYHFLDYDRELDPPLFGEDAVWADGLLREAGLR